MFRDRESADGPSAAEGLPTGRPAWQRKEGPDSPVGPAPAPVVPATATPAGPILGAQEASTPKPKGALNKKALAVVALIAALGVGGWYGQYYWTVGRYLVSTDDAYV